MGIPKRSLSSPPAQSNLPSVPPQKARKAPDAYNDNEDPVANTAWLGLYHCLPYKSLVALRLIRIPMEGPSSHFNFLFGSCFRS